jgi:hypothetical protein
MHRFVSRVAAGRQAALLAMREPMQSGLRSLLFVWLSVAVFACGGGTSGCACGGFTPLPQGTYSGTKQNTGGAARLSAQGFSALNANSTTILDFFAPGGQLTVPVPCSIEQVTIAGIPAVQLAVADTGQLSCAAESCGRMDGVCDADDYGYAEQEKSAAVAAARRVMSPRASASPRHSDT